MGANTTASEPERVETAGDCASDEDRGDPFASFTEWAEAEDEAAWAYLSDVSDPKLARG